MTATDTRGAIDAIWRIESARLIAGLARMVRDVGLAEDLAQDALVLPNGVTTTERVGRSMLAVARRGYARPVLDIRDINGL